MTWSKLDIFNLAANLLNKYSVNSFALSGDFSDSAERMIEILYPKVIEEGSWRFASKIQQLSVLVDPPPIADWWNYQLQLPSDWLATIRTYPRVPFQIYEDVIYCNSNVVYMEYRFLPDYTKIPASFAYYLAALLAQNFALSVADKDTRFSALNQVVEKALMSALFVDSQSHPTPSIVSRPLINVRGYGAPDTYEYGSNW